MLFNLYYDAIKGHNACSSRLRGKYTLFHNLKKLITRAIIIKKHFDTYYLFTMSFYHVIQEGSSLIVHETMTGGGGWCLFWFENPESTRYYLGGLINEM